MRQFFCYTKGLNKKFVEKLQLCVRPVFRSMRRFGVNIISFILRNEFNFSGTIPFQIYLKQILKAWYPKPLLIVKRLHFL